MLTSVMITFPRDKGVNIRHISLFLNSENIMERYYVIFNGYHDFIFAEPKTLKPTQLADREIQIARIGVF